MQNIKNMIEEGMYYQALVEYGEIYTSKKNFQIRDLDFINDTIILGSI